MILLDLRYVWIVGIEQNFKPEVIILGLEDSLYRLKSRSRPCHVPLGLCRVQLFFISLRVFDYPRIGVVG